MTDDKDQEPKIIVDDDWKTQAQAEKEKLAAEQAAGKEPAGPAGPAGGPRQFPPASFSAHVSTVASQALLAMGAMVDPQTKRPHVDLDLAKFHVDTLKVLEEKTAGNLTDEEKRLLDGTLYELRTRYIQMAQAGIGS